MKFRGFGIFKLLVVLGSNDATIQKERVDSAILEIQRTEHRPVTIDVFITGGSKLLPGHDLITNTTEAAQMYQQLSTQVSQTASINYILDNTATNTVSNFLMLNSYLESTDVIYDEQVIVTSDFHYERSKRIAGRIFGDHNDSDDEVPFRWVLSTTRGSPRYPVQTLRANERVYMSMIKSDIEEQSELSAENRIRTLQFCIF
jgi:hypothetical protein